MFSRRTNWNLSPNRLSQALARRLAAGSPVCDLTASNPTQCSFSCDREAILRAFSAPAALAYDPSPRGLLSARSAVAEYYTSRGVALAPDDIFLTASTSEAYSFVFRCLCDPGDEILVPAPSYPLFGFLADVLDVTLARYPLVYDDGWQIDFKSLEQKLTARSRAVIVVHPNNPTGHFCSSADAARLNELCSARNLALVADEVFLDFAHAGPPRASFAANSAVLTYTMSGLSKISGLPQMKLAWLVTSGPAHLKAESLRRMEIVADTFLSVGTPVQIAAPQLLASREEFQSQVLSRIHSNLAALDARLAGQSLCSRLDLEGGWYAVLRHPATRPGEDLAIELLETKGVHVHPGHFYDFPAEGYAVVSLITPEHDFSRGIDALLSLFFV